MLNGWAIDGRILARTGYPITLEGNEVDDPASGSVYETNVNLVPNQPTYLYGSQYPGGRSLNPSAFAFPTGTNPGNAPRNFARGFGESQLNFATRREFPISESLNLQFRAEAFHLFNHPSFSNPAANISSPGTVGQITSTFQEQIGEGSRQVHFSLRIEF